MAKRPAAATGHDSREAEHSHDEAAKGDDSHDGDAQGDDGAAKGDEVHEGDRSGSTAKATIRKRPAAFDEGTPTATRTVLMTIQLELRPN